jgi:hypothetical protein
MHAIPEIVAAYVRDKLKDDIENLLDDPHGVFQGMSATEIGTHMEELDQIARLVDLSLMKLLSTSGTNLEYARLMEILMKARAEIGFPAEKKGE